MALVSWALRRWLLSTVALGLVRVAGLPSGAATRDRVHLEILEPRNGAYYRVGSAVDLRVEIIVPPDTLARWDQEPREAAYICYRADYFLRHGCVSMWSKTGITLRDPPIGKHSVQVWVTQDQSVVPEARYGVSFSVGSRTFRFLQPEPFALLTTSPAQNPSLGMSAAPPKATTQHALEFVIDYNFILGGGTLILTSGSGRRGREDDDDELYRIDKESLTSQASPFVTRLQLDDVEPGTHAICATLATNLNASSRRVCTVFDVVFTPEGLAQHQYPVVDEDAPSQCIAPHREDLRLSAARKDPVRVTVVGTPTLDGQKMIWLRQIEHFQRRGFDFTFLHFSKPGYDAAALERLNSSLVAAANRQAGQPPREMPLKIQNLPTVSEEDLLELGLDFEGGFPRAERVAASIMEALSSAVEPTSWTAPWWQLQIDAFRKPNEVPDVVAFANSQSVSDQTLALAAEAAGVAVRVYELPNLFPKRCPSCSASVCPSTYACAHVARHSGLENVFVIPPGVDTDEFHPNSEGRPALCDALEISHGGDFKCGGCAVVGFVARLEPEKSPGLFVRAAKAVSQEATHCVKFLVVGDGSLRLPLEQMVADYGLAKDFYFAGVVNQHDASGNPMVETMAAIDVMVNPSLRAWSETFCIVNVEAMAMEIPIVSFGVGGTQEYLRDGENASILRESSPRALADAVLDLLGNADVREQMGAQGRRMAVESFGIALQMDRYEWLYRRLLSESRVEK
mmetsp:Transcript_31699/g.100712  ORF Transcript_31699/g.100712 Transcript_31699/m.100712 type:complete len:739 (-) Transcript_31699:31-2247(-)